MKSLQTNPFSLLGDVSVGPTTNIYFKDGRYGARIMDVKKKISEKPQTLGQTSVIIQFSIEKVITQYTDLITPGEKKKISSNPIGEVVTCHIMLAWGESSLKMLKRFLAAAAGISLKQAADIDSDKWFELAEKACYHLGDSCDYFDTAGWEDQPLRGGKVTIQAHTKKTTKGGDFTNVEFEIAN